MTTPTEPQSQASPPQNPLSQISLDWWAVLVALALVLLVLLNILPAVTW